MMDADEQQKPVDTSSKRTAIVVGSGIAGLTVAYYLKKHGVAVTLFERRSSVGGHVQTKLAEERYLLEFGPNAFLSTAEPVLRLARELSIDPQVVTNSASGKRRYVLRDQKLEQFPSSPASLLTTPALSLRGKIRLLLEPLVRSKGEADESLASFVRRRAGSEVLDALVGPFVSGVFAGDSEQLSAESAFPRLVQFEREHGSVLKGMMRKKRSGKHDLLSFRWGMGTLPARLEEVLRRDIQLNTTIESVERLRNGRLFVRVEAPRRTHEADAVILATPAWVSARIAAPLVPGMITPLMGIPYASIAVVHTAFPAKQVLRSLDGFGFLVSRNEKVRLLGSIWSSALFPGRSPAHEVLFVSYVGGSTDPLALDLDDDELLLHVREGLETSGVVRGDPTFVHVKRLHNALPQYTIGHRGRIEMVEGFLQQQPGVFLAGNYLRGISVADTIEHARTTADRVLKNLGVWSP